MPDVEQRLRDEFAALRGALELPGPDPRRVFGSGRRRWFGLHRHLGALFAAAVAVVGGSAGLAIALTVVHRAAPAGTPTTTAAPSPVSTAPSTTTEPPYEVPADFSVMSFSAVSAHQWWVLGSTACGARYCLVLVTTTDGGRSFQPLAAPETPFDPTKYTGPDVAPATAVRFADSRDGWLFGTGLYATHDGGRHWTQLSMPGAVDALEAAAGTAYAVVAPVCPPCTEQTPGAALWRAPVTSDAWAPDQAAGGVSAGLAVHGRSVWIMNSMPTINGPALGTGLLGSSDGGDHFTLEPQPAGGVVCAYSPVSDSVVWAYCSGGHFEFLQRSTDAGAHFSGVGSATLNDPDDPNQWPNGATMAAASDATVVAARAGAAGEPSIIVRTTDGGASWAQVAGPADGSGSGGWSIVGFTTPSVGYATWYDGPGLPVQLWRTVDGGATWARVAALP